MRYQIDHIVWAVPDFEKGIKHFEKITGVTPVFGGYHRSLGTKNALVNLGNASYFEILAIDEDSKISPPRWMGIDLISEPTITRWALKSEHLETDCEILKNYNLALGTIKEGQRTLTSGEILSWKLTMPIPEPKVEIAPFLLDWSESEAHPTRKLPVHCRLEQIAFLHPEKNKINSVLKDFGFDKFLRFGKEARISIQLETPNGLVKID